MTKLALAINVLVGAAAVYFCYANYRCVEALTDALIEAAERSPDRRRGARVTRIPRRDTGSEEA